MLTTHRYLTPLEGFGGVLPYFQQLLQKGGASSCPSRPVRVHHMPTASQKNPIHLNLGNLKMPCVFSRHITQKMHRWKQCRNTSVNFYVYTSAQTQRSNGVSGHKVSKCSLPISQDVCFAQVSGAGKTLLPYFITGSRSVNDLYG